MSATSNLHLSSSHYLSALDSLKGPLQQHTPLAGFVHLPQEQFEPTCKWHKAMAGTPIPSVCFQSIDAEIVGVNMHQMRVLSAEDCSKVMAGANDAVLEETGLKQITLRIMWPGYTTVLPWNRQLKLEPKPGEPTTRAELARDIARKFERFMDESVKHSPTSLTWAIGPEPRRINFDQLYLTTLYNVSNNSWQADVFIKIQ